MNVRDFYVFVEDEEKYCVCETLDANEIEFENLIHEFVSVVDENKFSRGETVSQSIKNL